MNLDNQNNKYYNCLISNNAKKTINEFYIPGGEPNPARMIRSFPQIKNFYSQQMIQVKELIFVHVDIGII